MRRGADGIRELAMARWRMPSSQFAMMEATKSRAAKLEAKGQTVDYKELLRMEPDGGTTNIRNTKSALAGPEHRCIVPFTSFSEFNRSAGGNIWFSFDDMRPLAFFAGIWTKIKEGETTNDLFGFLTTEPNAEVTAVHPKAMLVILTNPEEIEIWLMAPVEEALRLQRPLADGTLKIVATGTKKDEALVAACGCEFDSGVTPPVSNLA